MTNKPLNVFIISEYEPIFADPFMCAVIDNCNVVGIGLVSQLRRKGGALYILLHSIVRSSIIFNFNDYIKLFMYIIKLALNLPDKIRKKAKELNIPVFSIENVNSPETIAAIKDAQCDILIHLSPQILKSEIISTPSIGVINKHLAFIPTYRGCFTPFRAYMSGDNQYGVTLHWVDEGIDTGEIINVGVVTKNGNESLAKIVHKQNELACDLIVQSIKEIETHNWVKKAKAEGEGTYCRMPTIREMLGYHWFYLKKRFL